jgi:hypothetical protein
MAAWAHGYLQLKTPGEPALTSCSLVRTTIFDGSTLDDDLAAGAGPFTFTGNGTLTGCGSSPGVPATHVEIWGT